MAIYQVKTRHWDFAGHATWLRFADYQEEKLEHGIVMNFYNCINEKKNDRTN
jgi:hypothetical protein